MDPRIGRCSVASIDKTLPFWKILGKLAFKKLGICALFFVPFLDSLAEASLQGAGFIGRARQEGSIKNLNFL
ncbi:hypothetical protein K737_301042 [Holospora undulata HU1]|uniref:Uncharacterized protein n=1 Tax=Holospora undulata HU1 TaxID=1321371 RepID=A0A061JH06_9PROT|nr:hypothetical protein K737_301042 [Holospora undulata HU1]